MSSPSAPTRRVALIADAGFYVGPALARVLAARGHDLVLGEASSELVAELEATGTAVEAETSISRDWLDRAVVVTDNVTGAVATASWNAKGQLDSTIALSGSGLAVAATTHAYHVNGDPNTVTNPVATAAT